MAEILGQNFLLKLDTGADKCFVSKQILSDLGLPFENLNEYCILANGQCLPILGRVQLPLRFSNSLFITQSFEVISEIIHPFILGSNFITNPDNQIQINFSEGTLTCRGEELHLQTMNKNTSNLKTDPSLIQNTLATAKLTEIQKMNLNDLFCEYPEVFTIKKGTTNWAQHHIRVTTEIPISKPGYPLTENERKIMEPLLQEMLRDGIIRPSFSPYASPAFLVAKKTGDHRIVCNFRALNAITVKDPYPLPRIDSIVDIVGHPQYITALDLASGFHQVNMDPKDIEKTAFVTPFGKFENIKMPFGLCNAPSTFQRLMDRVLRHGRQFGVFVYIDDIIIASQTWEEHLMALRYVFQQLKAAGLSLKIKKCRFAQKETVVLGHKISSQGIAIEEEKIKAVTSFPRPRTIKQLSSFLGLVGWHQRFIPDLAMLSKPLNSLKKKGVRFHWGVEQERAFDLLKEAVVKACNLHAPEAGVPYTLTTDACKTGLGAMLTQKQGQRGEVPIAYASRTLNKAEQNYSTTEQECLAIVWAIQKFRCYLEGVQFTVITDHQALQWLFLNKNHKSRLVRWSLRLQEYDIKIQHRSGRLITAVDALSRNPVEEMSEVVDNGPVSMLGLLGTGPSVYQGLTKDELRESQKNDDYCKTLYQQLQNDPEVNRLTELGVDKILYRKAQGYDPAKPVLPASRRRQILELFHNHPAMGHRGIQGTYLKIKARYHWPKMYNEVRDFVLSCRSCQQYKANNKKRKGLMMNTKVHGPFEMLGTDIMGPLPLTSKRNRFLVVFTDYFTKLVILYPVKTITALSLSKVLVDVVSKYGAPNKILSDNGSQFISSLWKETCKLFQIVPKYTSLYHPQTNITERVNRVLGEMLSIYVGNCHRDWDKPLPFVQMAVNNVVHTSTGFSPFFLAHGREQRLPWEIDHEFSESLLTHTASRDYIQQGLQEHQRSIDIAKDMMSLAQEKQKKFYDQHYDPLNLDFTTNQLVWKLGHAQSNAALGYSKKFAPKWEGPYQIVRKISHNTYELKELISGRPGGNWHSHQLKMYVSAPDDDLLKLFDPIEDTTQQIVAMDADQTQDMLEPENVETNTLTTSPTGIELVEEKTHEASTPETGLQDIQSQTDPQTTGVPKESNSQETVPKTTGTAEPGITAEESIQNPLVKPFLTGWTRRVSVRKRQTGPGRRFDVYYQHKKGEIIRSVLSLRRYLTKHPNLGLKEDNFNFIEKMIYQAPYETITYA